MGSRGPAQKALRSSYDKSSHNNSLIRLETEARSGENRWEKTIKGNILRSRDGNLSKRKGFTNGTIRSVLRKPTAHRFDISCREYRPANQVTQSIHLSLMKSVYEQDSISMSA